MLSSILFVPVLTAIAGAALALIWRPGPTLASAIQHLAAGVVFATAATEILPDVLHAARPVPTLVGGALGVLAMLGLRRLEAVFVGPLGMLSAIGIDILVDGLVLGLGFAASPRAGLLLTVALALELLMLGLASVGALAEFVARPVFRLLIVAGLTLLLPLGVLLSAPVALMPEAIRLGMLSFGLMSLMFLVTEELLVEAHEIEERDWVTAMFFVGFLGLLLLDEMMP